MMDQEFEVITAEEAEELASRNIGRNNPTQSLLKLMENPSALGQQLNLNEEQVRNVKSVISGMGSAAAVKYLSAAFGSELAAAFGGFTAAFLSKKLFGGR